MRILVTGSNGMMGWGVRKIFPDAIFTDKSTLDVTKIWGWAEPPEIIFHLAAETDHHRAQSNPEHTYMVNFTGTMNMVEMAKRFDIPIVYVSTIGIFDGKKKNYSEQDEPNPLNHYARSKLYGERVVRTWYKHYIVRGGWGMGGGPYIDKKFINKIYAQIQEGTKTIYAVNDVFGSPTYTPDFAKTLKNIILRAYGTYHVASPDKCSRFELAQYFLKLLDSKVELKSVSKEEYHNLFPQEVRYQNWEVANTEKIVRMNVSEMRPWREALAEYVNEFCISK